MKKQIRYILVVFAFVLGCGAAFAQMVPERVVATVPFAFYVGKTELPAGQYEVFPEGDTTFDLVIRNMSTGSSVLVPVLSRSESGVTDRAELVFKNVDDKSYLAEVRPAEMDSYELASLPAKHAHGGDSSRNGK